MTATMKAVTYRRYGPPEVLQVDTVPRPTPKADEVLIRVHAAEVTKADCELRSFTFPVSWFWLPLRLAMGVLKPRQPILGGYLAGEVVEVGNQVSRFKPGDKVFGCSRLRLGAYGEYVALPEAYTIVPMPKDGDYPRAAAALLGGLNAVHFMGLAGLRPGARVLINGAGGSIGLFAVQLAKRAGAEVTAIDKGSKQDLLRRAGADHFIDYQREPFPKSPIYDVVFNMVAVTPFRLCLRAVAPTGHYLTGNPTLSQMLGCLWAGLTSKRQATFRFAEETHEELTTLRNLLDSGELSSPVDRVLPMDQAADAHHLVQDEERLGSIVLAIGAKHD